MATKRSKSPKKSDPKARAPRAPAAPNVLPDLAIQFVPCLEDLAGELGPNVVADLTGGIQSQLGDEADVRYRCLNLTGTLARTGTIAIWTSKPANFLDGLVRADSLKFVKPLIRGGNCWMYVNSNFLERELKKEFDKRPHRLTPGGQADEKGPIHIFTPTLSFDGPAKVVTTIPGLDERPLPDVTFRITLTDTLTVSSRRQIVCETKEGLDVDTGVLNLLTAAGLLTFLPAGIAFLVQRIKAGGAEPPAIKGSVGAVAAQFFGPQILLPAGKKVSFIYDVIQADASGLKTAGAQEIVARSPAVRITGPTNLKIRTQTFTSGTYTIVPTDLRRDFQFKWTVSSGIAATPRAEKTTIRFSRGSTQPGESFTRTVRVTVTDVDGLTASASLTVRVQVVDPEEDPPVGKPTKRQARAAARGRGAK
jgi:hypothetical protein